MSSKVTKKFFNSALILVITLSSYLPTLTFAKQNNACCACDHALSDPKVLSNNDIPLEEIQRFSFIVNTIKNYYVNPVDDKTIFHDAIKGALTGLDPHSNYLNIDEFHTLSNNIVGEFIGIGVEFSPEDGFIKVISPLDGSPAQAAGLKAGDLIIKIDNTPIRDMATDDAAKLLKGKPKTKVKLTVLRKGEDLPLVLTVIRDVIKSSGVKSVLFPHDFAYIRIPSFATSTGNNLISEIHKLNSKTINGIRGLILDLRNNPGGEVEGCVAVANTFLDKNKLKYDGKIIYTQGRVKELLFTRFATGKDLLNNAPMVILINEGSASAAEIVAGALQDHKRAIIMGQRSYGKGTVQSVIPLPDGYGMKITTALYFTPAGRSIQVLGIEPDIELKNIQMPKNDDDKTKELKETLKIREADLTGHLANGNAPAETKTELNNETKNEEKKETKEIDENNKQLVDMILKNDYQVGKALDVLTALDISRENKN